MSDEQSTVITDHPLAGNLTNIANGVGVAENMQAAFQYIISLPNEERAAAIDFFKQGLIDNGSPHWAYFVETFQANLQVVDTSQHPQFTNFYNGTEFTNLIDRIDGLARDPFVNPCPKYELLELPDDIKPIFTERALGTILNSISWDNTLIPDYIANDISAILSEPDGSKGDNVNTLIYNLAQIEPLQLRAALTRQVIEELNEADQDKWGVVVEQLFLEEINGATFNDPNTTNAHRILENLGDVQTYISGLDAFFQDPFTNSLPDAGGEIPSESPVKTGSWLGAVNSSLSKNISDLSLSLVPSNVDGFPEPSYPTISDGVEGLEVKVFAEVPLYYVWQEDHFELSSSAVSQEYISSIEKIIAGDTSIRIVAPYPWGDPQFIMEHGDEIIAAFPNGSLDVSLLTPDVKQHISSRTTSYSNDAILAYLNSSFSSATSGTELPIFVTFSGHGSDITTYSNNQNVSLDIRDDGVSLINTTNDNITQYISGINVRLYPEDIASMINGSENRSNIQGIFLNACDMGNMQYLVHQAVGGTIPVSASSSFGNSERGMYEGAPVTDTRMQDYDLPFDLRAIETLTHIELQHRGREDKFDEDFHYIYDTETENYISGKDLYLSILNQIHEYIHFESFIHSYLEVSDTSDVVNRNRFLDALGLTMLEGRRLAFQGTPLSQENFEIYKAQIAANIEASFAPDSQSYISRSITTFAEYIRQLDKYADSLGFGYTEINDRPVLDVISAAKVDETMQLLTFINLDFTDVAETSRPIEVCNTQQTSCTFTLPPRN